MVILIMRPLEHKICWEESHPIARHHVFRNQNVVVVVVRNSERKISTDALGGGAAMEVRDLQGDI